MISSNDLKPGLTILVDGEIYTVLEAATTIQFLKDIHYH